MGLPLEFLGNNMLMSTKGKQLWKRLLWLSLFPFLASQGEACSGVGLFLLGQHTEAQMLFHTGRALQASKEGNPSHLLVSISPPLPQAGRNAPSPSRSPLYYPFYVWGEGVFRILQSPKINWQAPPLLVLSWKHCWCSPSSQNPLCPPWSCVREHQPAAPAPSSCLPSSECALVAQGGSTCPWDQGSLPTRSSQEKVWSQARWERGLVNPSERTNSYWKRHSECGRMWLSLFSTCANI